MFAVFSFSLAMRVLYQLCTEEQEATKVEGDVQAAPPNPFSPSVGLILIGSGFFGGLCVGYIGLGIESVVFFVLTWSWNVDHKQATVTAIVAIGWTACFAFSMHLLYRSDVPIYKWLMILPGVCAGE